MKTLMAAMRACSIGIATLTISACATPGGTVAVVAVGNVTKNNAHTLPVATVNVAIPKHSASTGSSALSSIPPLTVRVLPFNDDRKHMDMEGSATAAFGVPMAHVRFDPSPATLLGHAIIAEIKAAGHTLTNGAEGTQITGSILEFGAHTDTTMLYWDVIGNLAVSVQIMVARATTPAAPLDYRARCRERTYVWPSEAVIAAVMSKCIEEFAGKLRNDGRAAAALRKALSSL